MTCCQRGDTRRRNLPVLKRAHAADSQAAYDKSADLQRNAAFGRDHAGQGEMDQPSAQHGVFRSLGRASKRDSGMGFLYGRLDTAELGVVAAFQIEQMAAVVHHGDGYTPAVAPRFSFSG